MLPTAPLSGKSGAGTGTSRRRSLFLSIADQLAGPFVPGAGSSFTATARTLLVHRNDPEARAGRLPGKRQTRQRNTIYNVIGASRGPLTVQEIHERARQNVSGLGIATVYRTLKLLQDRRMVQQVILPNGETRYERTGLGHHHHFSCRVCDEVFDLETCPVDIPRDGFAGGFVVESHDLTLYGICPECG